MYTAHIFITFGLLRFGQPDRMTLTALLSQLSLKKKKKGHLATQKKKIK